MSTPSFCIAIRLVAFPISTRVLGYWLSGRGRLSSSLWARSELSRTCAWSLVATRSHPVCLQRVIVCMGLRSPICYKETTRLSYSRDGPATMKPKRAGFKALWFREIQKCLWLLWLARRRHFRLNNRGSASWV
ncbi:hypothetical protein LY76DRAFT_421347 [Colletotrichum caudatum]|nr:hypothetical protein LY76DRAFT_421347 [Colletotrichum caudatum]